MNHYKEPTEIEQMQNALNHAYHSDDMEQLAKLRQEYTSKGFEITMDCRYSGKMFFLVNSHNGTTRNRKTAK